VKLNARQLSQHLSKGLAPVYLVSGDEPLLVDEALDAIRVVAEQDGYTDRESHVAERTFDWAEFAAGLQNLSLFASRRIIQIRLPTGKPGDKGGRCLTALATQPVPDTVIVVITPKLDGKTTKSKWASTLAREGVWLPLYAPAPAELPGWLEKRLRASKLTATPAALEFLALQVEGNLLAAKQEIDKLSLLAEDGHVDIETVRKSVADGARFDVFQLTDAALAGNAARAARILHCLQREGVAAPLVMWSLAREIGVVADILFRAAAGVPLSRAIADAKVWSSRASLFGNATRRHDLSSARQLLSGASRADRIVKGAFHGQTWNALLELTLMLAGDQAVRAELA
jgi:DNA polymerase-3 subunit delta